MTRPIHWPSLTPDEAEEERHDLVTWVAGYRQRYPASVELPQCWSKHPDIVEALTALRDCERGCFDSRSAGCAAMDWQRARRDTDTMLMNWISRLPCAIPGRTHPTAGDEPDNPGTATQQRSCGPVPAQDDALEQRPQTTRRIEPDMTLDDADAAHTWPDRSPARDSSSQRPPARLFRGCQ